VAEQTHYRQGLVPGGDIKCVKTENAVILKATWERWSISLFMLLGSLLFFLPVIVGFLVPEKANYGSMIMCGVPGVFILWVGIKFSLRRGRVVWRYGASELIIHYGTLLARRKLMVPIEGVRVRLYMYKANQPGWKLKYGVTVLSLMMPGQVQEELVIVAANKESRIITAYELLQEVFGPENCDYGLERMPEETGDLPCDEWQVLVNASRTKRTFLYTQSIFVKTSSQQVSIRLHWVRWLVAVLPMTMGVFMLFGAVYFRHSPLSRQIMTTLGGCMGLFLIYLSYRMSAGMASLSWSRWGDSVNLRYGYFPFAKKLCIKKNELEVHLYKCDPGWACKTIKPGNIVLSLVRNRNVNLELVVATARKRTLLIRAYEEIAKFLDQPVDDETQEEIKLPDGRQMSISTATLTGGGKVEDDKRKMIVVSEDLLLFRRAWTVFFLLLFGIGVFIVCMILPFVEREGEITTSLGGIIAGLAIGCFFLVLSGGFFIYQSCSWYIVANKAKDMLSVNSLINKRGKGKLLCNLSEILMVQACSIFTVIQSGNSIRWVTVYEMNIVLDRPEDNRINMTCSMKKDRFFADTKRFAEFLGVPLLDHTE